MASIELNNLPFPDSNIDDEKPNLALGRFMTVWAQIEVVCGFLFRKLTDLNYDLTMIIFDNVSNVDQLAMLTQICELLPKEEHRVELQGLFAEVQKFSTIRNKIVHASWGEFNREPARFSSNLTSQQMDEIFNETQKGKSLADKLIFPVTRMEKFIPEMINLRDRLEKSLDAIEIPDGPLSRHQRKMEEHRREMLERRDKWLAERDQKP